MNDSFIKKCSYCEITLEQQNLVSVFETKPNKLYCFNCFEKYIQLLEYNIESSINQPQKQKGKIYYWPNLEQVKQQLKESPPYSILDIQLSDKNDNKDSFEYTVEKPIFIKGEKGEEFTVRCSECNDYFAFPKEPPICSGGCGERIDICKHGISCWKCSRKLMLEWIREGNMKVGEALSLEEIKKMIKDECGLEVYVNENGYLAIKK